MKLYTGKEINKILNFFQVKEDDIVKIINELTPIELPSDEEIRERGWEDSDVEDDIAFFNGAKWMKEQILNQNK